MRKFLDHIPAVSRRQFIKVCSSGLAIASLAPGSVLASSGERRLAFHNLHTGESAKIVYWANGKYLHDGLSEINHILRDHRTDEVKAMSPQLMDLLYSLRARLDTRQPFHVISGYRSPATNAMLHASSDGVAKQSLHMQGMAIDIRVPGSQLTRVRKAALAMRQGGVGYYPSSDFLHVDTGRVRSWGG